ncbi:hypothetical protein LTR08_005550 [Meristemomyces frigidus]|nr:hypothetical protein LTR08_005550 [Meristemomyces frigidus]
MADFWKGIGAWAEQTAGHAKDDIVGAPAFLAWAGDEVGKNVGPWAQEAANKAKNVGAEAGSRMEQSAKGVVSELSKIDLTAVNDWIHGVAADVQQAINQMGSEERSGFEKWLRDVNEGIGLHALLDDLQTVKLEDLPAETLRYVKENPGQKAILIISGLAFIAPGLVYGPALGLLGFGPGGVGAGTIAASVQSEIGGAVGAGSGFATLTSAGAGGYGVAAVSGVTRAAVIGVGAVVVLAGHAHKDRKLQHE